MLKFILLVGMILSSSLLFADDQLGLKCSGNGKVHYGIYHGEGYGCGESGKTIIKKQTRDWSKKTVYVETAWLPGKLAPGSVGRCHYYGPIYGGGAIDTYIGTWKVIIDGKLKGAYTHKIDSEQVSKLESKYTLSCSLELE
jgi:hypothetical protein